MTTPQTDVDGALGRAFLAETADERAEEILGALYDYAESIAPSRY